MEFDVIIIEDEPQAADRLEGLVNKLAPGMNVKVRLGSVRESVSWLKNNHHPSLIFMDIQLGDGISFDIFKQVDVTCPVIFTTAYDEYALKAFKVNSIDYLLKPIDEGELKIALDKYLKMNVSSGRMLESISLAVEMITKKYKTRFIVKIGEKLKSVEVQEIEFFFSLDRTTFAQTTDGRKHIVDFSLDQLDGVLDPGNFFRINRKYIVSVRSIQDMISHTNSRIKLILRKNEDDDVIVARERVQEFKEWLDK